VGVLFRCSPYGILLAIAIALDKLILLYSNEASICADCYNAIHFVSTHDRVPSCDDLEVNSKGTEGEESDYETQINHVSADADEFMKTWDYHDPTRCHLTARYELRGPFSKLSYTRGTRDNPGSRLH
jgi:hypothetical protein